MPYRALLKETFEKYSIRRVAIVDDAFDKPNFSKITSEYFRRLKNDINDLYDREDAEGVSITVLDELARLLNHNRQDLAREWSEENDLSILWTAYVEATRPSPLHTLLHPLFVTLYADRNDKLGPLQKLKELIVSETGAEVAEFDSATQPEAIVDFDMIFLDYYLSDDLPHKLDGSLRVREAKRARAESIGFLAKLIESAKNKVPLVMLISSAAKSEDIPEFRREAKMLASKLSFLPKKLAEIDPARTQHTIIALARYRNEGDALWDFLKTWRMAVTSASDELMISLRELDLTDYSYIQEFRLAAEKTPLSQYLVWLFSGQLTDLVERKLYAASADSLVRGLELPKAIPGRVGPTSAITKLYSALIASELRVEDDSFKPKAWAGDIFLDTASYNEIFFTKLKVVRKQKSMPQILAVITPSCDLVPDRGPAGKLKTVTMVGGTLTPLDEAKSTNNHLVMLNEKAFVIDWNTKWPVTMSLEAMDKKNNIGGRYKWVGRLREMYHAELQHRLFADVGRVGLPVAPTMSMPVSLRVYAKTSASAAGYTLILEAEASDRRAWTFNGLGGQRTYGIREEVAWEIRQWVIDKYREINTEPYRKLFAKVEIKEFIDHLQKPISYKKDNLTYDDNKIGVKFRTEKSLDDFSASGETALFVFLFCTQKNFVSPSEMQTATA